MRKWEELPEFMQCDEVKEYYDILQKKKVSLVIKRIFDIVIALILLIILLIPMIIISIMIKIDSKGTIFYRQERVTTYGKKFKIHKFRTMVSNADKIGTTITTNNDSRITKVGNKLRNCRLDELPQLIDILEGNMSFVGTRPEATKYVERYTNEMKATLLMPAGITSEASIRFKDEAELLNDYTIKNVEKEFIMANVLTNTTEKKKCVDDAYVKIVLPQKMKYNLESIKNFSFINDIKTMFRTVFAVLGK